MIAIEYGRSSSGNENCFHIQFEHKRYIPKEFFQKNKNGSALLCFYISLLQRFDMLGRGEEHCHRYLWSRHYDCVYNEIPFTMVYDEDYDMVSFSLLPENAQYKTVVAERIGQLVEKEGDNLSQNSNI